MKAILGVGLLLIAVTTLVTREGEEISYTVCNKAEGGILGGIGALFIGLGERNGYFLLQRCKVPSRIPQRTLEVSLA